MPAEASIIMKAAARITQRYDDSSVSTLSVAAAFHSVPTLVLTCHTPYMRLKTRSEVLPEDENTLRKPYPSLPTMRSKINTRLLPHPGPLPAGEGQDGGGDRKPLARDHRQHNMRGMGSVVENCLRRRLQLSVSK